MGKTQPPQAERARQRIKQQNEERQRRMREAQKEYRKPPPKQRRKVSASRREVITYTAERLECVQATFHYRVAGRDGHGTQTMEIRQVERGLLEAYINGETDHSRHVIEAMKRGKIFFRDMAEVMTRTINGRLEQAR